MWPNGLFNVFHLQQWKFAQLQKIAKVNSNFAKDKTTLTMFLPKSNKILPKWGNLGKSGHANWSKTKNLSQIKGKILQQCEWKLIFSRKLKNLNGNAGWPPHGFEFMNFWHKIIYLTLFNFWNESSECSWARLVQDDSDPKYLISYEFFFSLNGKCFQWTTILIVCLNRKRENFKNIFIEGAKRIIAVMTL